jgi:hypothetical protein
MNAIGSISRPHLIAAGLVGAGLIGGCLALTRASDETVKDVVQLTSMTSVIVGMSGAHLIAVAIGFNALSVILELSGKLEIASKILNNSVLAYFNKHTVAIISITSLVCTVGIIGMLYLNRYND